MRCAVTVAVLFLALVVGCSKSGPATVTPEMIAEQQAAEKQANAEEAAMQKEMKNKPRPGSNTVDDEERAMQQKRR